MHWSGGGWAGGWGSRGLQSESPRDGRGGQVGGWGLVDESSHTDLSTLTTLYYSMGVGIKYSLSAFASTQPHAYAYGRAAQLRKVTSR